MDKFVFVECKVKAIHVQGLYNSARDEDFDASMIALRPKPEGRGVFSSQT